MIRAQSPATATSPPRFAIELAGRAHLLRPVAYARAYYKFCGPGRPQEEHTNLSSAASAHALHALRTGGCGGALANAFTGDMLSSMGSDTAAPSPFKKVLL